MRYLAAYLLAQLGGVGRPQESNIRDILSSVGIECEEERAKLVRLSIISNVVRSLNKCVARTSTS